MNNEKQIPQEVTRKPALLKGSELRASTLGWEIAIPLFSGPLIGLALDSRLHSGMRWTLICLALGLLVAIMSVVKHVHYEFYCMNKSESQSKNEGRNHE